MLVVKISDAVMARHDIRTADEALTMLGRGITPSAYRAEKIRAAEREENQKILAEETARMEKRAIAARDLKARELAASYEAQRRADRAKKAVPVRATRYHRGDRLRRPSGLYWGNS